MRVKNVAVEGYFKKLFDPCMITRNSYKSYMTLNGYRDFSTTANPGRLLESGKGVPLYQDMFV